MVVLTTDFSPRDGNIMPLVVRPCSASVLITQHIGAMVEAFRCNSFYLLLHGSASLAVNRCCLVSKITGTPVSSDSLICAQCDVMGGTPEIDLACQLRRNSRSSRLSTSFGSHQPSLPLSGTTWTQATCKTRTLSGTMAYVMVRVQSFPSAALAFFMHLVCSSSKVGCASIETLRQHVACGLNRNYPVLTLIFAPHYGRRCFL